MYGVLDLLDLLKRAVGKAVRTLEAARLALDECRRSRTNVFEGPSRAPATKNGVLLVTTNSWCKTLGIEPPKFEVVAGHREANNFALLLVALLERGGPMTLAEVAARFEEAGLAERPRALLSLQRCKPGRPLVYREGDLYHLDPHNAELGFWSRRLELHPPRFALPPPAPAVEPAPIPGPFTPLSSSELDEAWKDAALSSWSAQRLAVAVLDAHGGPLSPTEVVMAVAARTKWHGLSCWDSAKFKRSRSAIAVLDDGRWAIAQDAATTVMQTRVAVRDRVARARRSAATRVDPAMLDRLRVELEEKRAAHAAELAGMSRALLVAFPAARPTAAALLDVGKHELTTFAATSSPRCGRGSPRTTSSAVSTCAGSCGHSTSIRASAGSPNSGRRRRP